MDQLKECDLTQIKEPSLPSDEGDSDKENTKKLNVTLDDVPIQVKFTYPKECIVGIVSETTGNVETVRLKPDHLKRFPQNDPRRANFVVWLKAQNLNDVQPDEIEQPLRQYKVEATDYEEPSNSKLAKNLDLQQQVLLDGFKALKKVPQASKAKDKGNELDEDENMAKKKKLVEKLGIPHVGHQILEYGKSIPTPVQLRKKLKDGDWIPADCGGEIIYGDSQKFFNETDLYFLKPEKVPIKRINEDWELLNRLNGDQDKFMKILLTRKPKDEICEEHVAKPKHAEGKHKTKGDETDEEVQETADNDSNADFIGVDNYDGLLTEFLRPRVKMLDFLQQTPQFQRWLNEQKSKPPEQLISGIVSLFPDQKRKSAVAKKLYEEYLNIISRGYPPPDQPCWRITHLTKVVHAPKTQEECDEENRAYSEWLKCHYGFYKKAVRDRFRILAIKSLKEIYRDSEDDGDYFSTEGSGNEEEEDDDKEEKGEFDDDEEEDEDEDENEDEDSIVEGAAGRRTNYGDDKNIAETLKKKQKRKKDRKARGEGRISHISTDSSSVQVENKMFERLNDEGWKKRVDTILLKINERLDEKQSPKENIHKLYSEIKHDMEKVFVNEKNEEIIKELKKVDQTYPKIFAKIMKERVLENYFPLPCFLENEFGADVFRNMIECYMEQIIDEEANVPTIKELGMGKADIAGVKLPMTDKVDKMLMDKMFDPPVLDLPKKEGAINSVQQALLGCLLRRNRKVELTPVYDSLMNVWKKKNYLRQQACKTEQEGDVNIYKACIDYLQANSEMFNSLLTVGFKHHIPHPLVQLLVASHKELADVTKGFARFRKTVDRFIAANPQLRNIKSFRSYLIRLKHSCDVIRDELKKAYIKQKKKALRRARKKMKKSYELQPYKLRTVYEMESNTKRLRLKRFLSETSLSFVISSSEGERCSDKSANKEAKEEKVKKEKLILEAMEDLKKYFEPTEEELHEQLQREFDEIKLLKPKSPPIKKIKFPETCISDVELYEDNDKLELPPSYEARLKLIKKKLLFNRNRYGVEMTLKQRAEHYYKLLHLRKRYLKVPAVRKFMYGGFIPTQYKIMFRKLRRNNILGVNIEQIAFVMSLSLEMIDAPYSHKEPEAMKKAKRKRRKSSRGKRKGADSRDSRVDTEADTMMSNFSRDDKSRFGSIKALSFGRKESDEPDFQTIGRIDDILDSLQIMLKRRLLKSKYPDDQVFSVIKEYERYKQTGSLGYEVINKKKLKKRWLKRKYETIEKKITREERYIRKRLNARFSSRQEDDDQDSEEDLAVDDPFKLNLSVGRREENLNLNPDLVLPTRWSSEENLTEYYEMHTLACRSCNESELQKPGMEMEENVVQGTLDDPDRDDAAKLFLREMMLMLSKSRKYTEEEMKSHPKMPYYLQQHKLAKKVNEDLVYYNDHDLRTDYVEIIDIQRYDYYKRLLTLFLDIPPLFWLKKRKKLGKTTNLTCTDLIYEDADSKNMRKFDEDEDVASEPSEFWFNIERTDPPLTLYEVCDQYKKAYESWIKGKKTIYEDGEVRKYLLQKREEERKRRYELYLSSEHSEDECEFDSSEDEDQEIKLSQKLKKLPGVLESIFKMEATRKSVKQNKQRRASRLHSLAEFRHERRDLSRSRSPTEESDSMLQVLKEKGTKTKEIKRQMYKEKSDKYKIDVDKIMAGDIGKKGAEGKDSSGQALLTMYRRVSRSLRYNWRHPERRFLRDFLCPHNYILEGKKKFKSCYGILKNDKSFHIADVVLYKMLKLLYQSASKKYLQSKLREVKHKKSFEDDEPQEHAIAKDTESTDSDDEVLAYLNRNSFDNIPWLTLSKTFTKEYVKLRKSIATDRKFLLYPDVCKKQKGTCDACPHDIGIVKKVWGEADEEKARREEFCDKYAKMNDVRQYLFHDLLQRNPKGFTAICPITHQVKRLAHEAINQGASLAYFKSKFQDVDINDEVLDFTDIPPESRLWKTTVRSPQESDSYEICDKNYKEPMEPKLPFDYYYKLLNFDLDGKKIDADEQIPFKYIPRKRLRLPRHNFSRPFKVLSAAQISPSRLLSGLQSQKSKRKVKSEVIKVKNN